jgi:transaldolase
VDTLIGPDTVNTMPDATVDKFLDHGTVARTVDIATEVTAARQLFAALDEAGVDLADVAATLEAEGVASFAASFDELKQVLGDKAAALSGGPAPA